MLGTIKFYLPAPKGYGFLETEGQGDFFFHVTQATSIEESLLVKGLSVQFEVGENPKNGKQMAYNIQLFC